MLSGMEMVACTCDNLPIHDHHMGLGLDENGVLGPVWDQDDVGHVWVNWKAVARAILTDRDDEILESFELEQVGWCWDAKTTPGTWHVWPLEHGDYAGAKPCYRMILAGET